MSALLEAGITDFYDLTETHELHPYEPLLQELAKAKDSKVVVQRFAIKDVDVPDSVPLEAVLSALAATVSAGRKAAVHCWGGVGRTGTVLGCYLVRTLHISGEEALARIAHEWEGVEKRNRKPNSPETAAQCQLVKAFR